MGGGSSSNYILLKIYKKAIFYYAYGNDAIILNYLFKYKISNDTSVGFPESALNKVQSTLENLKIPFGLYFDEANHYEYKVKQLNYDKYLNLSLKKLSKVKRIDKIIDKLNNCSEEQLLNILEVSEKCLK